MELDCSERKNVALAQQLLMLGETVAIPTETVYGLAANALEEDAVVKIFEIKNRPTFDPLIIHTNTIEKVLSFVEEIPAELLPLAEAFWPGPLTLLLPKKNCIPDLVTAGCSRVAVRIPNHPLTLALLAELDFPLAAPSANPFGYVSPTCAAHVASHLGKRVAYILDGGYCEIGLESTIVGLEAEGITIYRQGGIAQEDIERIVGKVRANTHSSSNPTLPGTLSTHYAPRTPLLLGNLTELIANHEHLSSHTLGVIAYAHPIAGIPACNQMLLAPDAQLTTAARNLFATLREMDKRKFKVILAENVPQTGLGRAINDRLRRAACHTLKPCLT